MQHVPDAVRFSAFGGWAIIAAVGIFALARPRMGFGGSVTAAALAAVLTKTILLDLFVFA